MRIESTFLMVVVILQLSIAIVILYLIFRRFPRSAKTSGEKTALPQRETVDKKKYAHSGISEALAGDLKNKVLQLMEEEKVYLDSDLKLKDLADRLGLSVPNTSQLINQNLHKDFNTFINEYRIEAAIDLLESNASLTLQNVAYETGFNNNVTFYKAFKKYKGTSPSEYLKEVILNHAG